MRPSARATGGGAARVSVLMPVFDQAAFIARAVGSLRAQTLADWELVVVDDGSQDATPQVLAGMVGDPRIRWRREAGNRGLGAALNVALDTASAPLVAYLPADDRYDPEHLETLVAALGARHAMAVSGVRHHGDQEALGAPPGHPLQLVQVLHRRTGDRWLSRAELESDDLERLFWSALRRRGAVGSTEVVTCEWVDHPAQRHKAIREAFDGGLNVFRRRYAVATPLRFHSSDGPAVDEAALYRRFRERPRTPPAADGLRILLVGELSYNPERVLALEERGHRLFGLWTDEGLGFNTVGPLPFGHVADVPLRGWRAAVRRLRPDVVYALLNWRAVPLAHEVLGAALGVPFVFHFKESPGRCLANGTWPHLVDLVTRSDHRIYASEEERRWFELALPGRLDPAHSSVLDGDLPKRDWLDGERAPRLALADGAIHTVSLGRPVGFDAALVRALAERSVHVHLHGLVRSPGFSGSWTGWLEEALRAARGHLHLHEHVDQRGWVSVLSRYDAGWLHVVRSRNGGDLGRASWGDLNLPARIPTLLAAGVPLIAPESPGCAVASQELIRRLGAGVLYRDVDDLCAQLAERAAMEGRRRRAWAAREEMTFDAHADRLVDVLRAAVDRRAGAG